MKNFIKIVLFVGLVNVSFAGEVFNEPVRVEDMLTLHDQTVIADAVKLYSYRALYLFGIDIEVKCVYHNMGSVAGEADVVNGKVIIKLNPVYYVYYGNEFLTTTVPHEVGHGIAMLLSVDDGHGSNWKSIVEAIGGKASQYHAFNSELAWHAMTDENVERLMLRPDHILDDM